MNILLTGVTGFIGTHLCRALVGGGSHRVHALLRPDSDRSLLPAAVQVIVADDGLDLCGCMEALAIDGVVHLASCFIAEHGAGDIDRLIDANLRFGTELIDAAARANVRWFINTASFWQHFDNRDGNPGNLYAATKEAFECILGYYRARYPIRIVSLELVDTYGPDDRRRKLVGILLEAMQNGAELQLSPGEQRLCFVHVDDVVAAYEIAIARLGDERMEMLEKYAVFSDERLTLRQFVTLVAQVFDREIKAVWGGRPYRSCEYMEPRPLHPILPGWKPRLTLEQGLRTLRAGTSEN